MKILVPWDTQSNKWWNDVCADIITHFGLPGDRYNTHVTEDCMKFVFHNDKDALMCRILVSDCI